MSILQAQDLHINVTIVHGDATPTSFQSYSWEQVALRAIEWNKVRERDGLLPVIAVYCSESSYRDEDGYVPNRKLTCHTLSDLAIMLNTFMREEYPDFDALSQ